jgi:hypothetical protein
MGRSRGGVRFIEDSSDEEYGDTSILHLNYLGANSEEESSDSSRRKTMRMTRMRKMRSKEMRRRREAEVRRRRRRMRKRTRRRWRRWRRSALVLKDRRREV